MSAANIVDQLMKRLEPLMAGEAETISRGIAGVRARVSSLSFGESLNRGRYCSTGISCLIEGAPADQPDNLDLLVSVYDIASSPRVNGDLCWGHPSGKVEFELYPEPKVLTETVVSDVVSSIPVLFGQLERLLKLATEQWRAR